MFEARRRRYGLIILCSGVLMTTLDAIGVSIALPTIKTALGFSPTHLAWVINAYLITFSGFRLLSGRLGDLFGHRRLFLHGILVFTFASLGCALATSSVQLTVARALQGLGSAIVGASALPLILNSFPEETGRAKAIGVYGFIAMGGGTAGLLLGGSLTSVLGWRWIFLVNLPIGAAVYLSCGALITETAETAKKRGNPDIWGAVTVTTAVTLAVYAVVGANESGWASVNTLIPLSGALVLLVLFVSIETRARAPLIPLSVFRRRPLVVFLIVNMLVAVAGSNGMFVTLYLQLIARYTPMQVSLICLPGHLLGAAISLGVSAKLVIRFGITWPLVVGLLLAAAGIFLLAHAPVEESAAAIVMAAMLLLSLGIGVAANPLLLAVMRGVAPDESGLVSGIVNTANMMTTALALAIFASVAARRTAVLLASDVPLPYALNAGYHIAFLLNSAFVLVAALIGALFARASLARQADCRSDEPGVFPRTQADEGDASCCEAPPLES
jgi:EmrB/QacA subfamily drug resistance transporter